MFRGLSAINIDAKGRVIVPMRYRGILETQSQNKIVITIDTEQACLLLYPFVVWEEIEQKIAALPSFNPLTRRIQRLLIGHATEEELDANGRILLPPPLREYAQLKQKAVLVGQGKKFEIWAEESWHKERGAWLGEKLLTQETLPEELKDLSL